jgi:hypothetical protein
MSTSDNDSGYRGGLRAEFIGQLGAALFYLTTKETSLVRHVT